MYIHMSTIGHLYSVHQSIHYKTVKDVHIQHVTDKKPCL